MSWWIYFVQGEAGPPPETEGGPDPDWLEEAAKSYGEALDWRFSMRLDTGAGSNQLVVLARGRGGSGLEAGLSIPTIERKRERSYGVVQGHEWTVRIAHDTGLLNPRSENFVTTAPSIIGKWGVLEIGFADADLWAVFAQGRCRFVEVSTEAYADIVIQDPIMDLLSWELPRDQAFDDRDAWCSEVYEGKRSSTSKGYDNTNYPPAVIAVLIGSVKNEGWRIEFVSATTYNVYYGVNGTLIEATGAPFSIAADHDLKAKSSGLAVVRIYSAGWDQAQGAYAAGDTFYVFSSKKYASADLTPVALLERIIGDAGVAGGLDDGFVAVAPVDVLNGAPYADWRYNPSYWDQKDSDLATAKFRGIFKKGTNAMDMIQGILRIVGGSIWPSNDGRIGLWIRGPAEQGATTAQASGDPARPPVNILEGRRRENVADVITRLTVRYKSIEPQQIDARTDTYPDAIFITEDATATMHPRDGEVETDWAVDPTTVAVQATNLLNRFKEPEREYVLRGTLPELAGLELVDLLSITEPAFDDVFTKIVVTEISLDVESNEVEVVGAFDPVVALSYAVVGVSTVDGPDLVW